MKIAFGTNERQKIVWFLGFPVCTKTLRELLMCLVWRSNLYDSHHIGSTECGNIEKGKFIEKKNAF